VAEPLVLGLLVAPSAAGGSLAAAALVAFLGRQPARLWIGDVLRGRRYPRTRLAAALAATLGLVAVILTAVAARQAAASFWIFLASAGVFLGPQLAYDARNRGRTLAAELLGASAPGALAAAISRCAGWGEPEAAALWLVLAARSVPSVLYVRARLRLERGQSPRLTSTVVSHASAVALAAALVVQSLAPWAAVAATLLLAARALVGLSAWRWGRRPQTVGLVEVAVGIAFVALVAGGYRVSPGAVSLRRP
jgi:hypothetical protein